MASNLAISAVVPIHNEAGFLETALPRLIAEMESVGRNFEVVLAENGSSDGTKELADAAAVDDPRVRVVTLPEADYGAAMRQGFMETTADWVVNFDIDYFSAEFVLAALDVESRADLVLASKRIAGSDDRRSAYRRLATMGFNVVLRLLFRSGVSDTHGMKMIRREVIDELADSVISTQDLFDTELVLRSERAGYRIVEVPTVVEEMRSARTALMGRIPRTLKGLLRIRRRMPKRRRH